MILPTLKMPSHINAGEVVRLRGLELSEKHNKWAALAHHDAVQKQTARGLRR